MISFNNKGITKFIDNDKYNNLLTTKDKANEKLKDYYMTGWLTEVDDKIVTELYQLRDEVKRNSECMVVLGIGGSYLGSSAVNSIFCNHYHNDFEVFYAGNSLSSEQIEDLFNYLDDKDFTLNVISKSGSTIETKVAYELLKEYMLTKYNLEEFKRRVIVTTSIDKGVLLDEAKKYDFKILPFPDNIGGRYSIMTYAHLFPLSFNIDLKEFIKGYNNGKNYNEEAFKYAVGRNLLFEDGKYVENFICNNPKFLGLLEWIKQLFAESEGKDNKGILPIAMLFTRDLHSLGQYIQDGKKVIFETLIISKESNKILYNNKKLHEINNAACISALNAHNKGNVPTSLITIDKTDEENIGELMYFLMMSAAYSALLFDVDPFDQPGVDVYKNEIRENNVL